MDTLYDATALFFAAASAVGSSSRTARGMSGGDPFALGQSALNDFLFAEIGTEPNGMPLSLLSAFARGGKDPWQEAQRFAELPGHLAVSGLAGLIATSGAQRGPEATTIAQHLVKLLPGRQRGPAIPDIETTWSKGQRVLQAGAVLVAVMLAAALLVSVDLGHLTAVGPAPAAVPRAGAMAVTPPKPAPMQVPSAE